MPEQHSPPTIHSTAVVEEGANVAAGATIWHFCHVRNGADIGTQVSLGKDVYIDSDVVIGNFTRVQNGVSIYRGVEIHDWCFIGPNVVFTNDLRPRSGSKSWAVASTCIETGASIGAGATIICGITLGVFSMTAAGAVVTESVPAFHLAIGLPAKVTNMICACGETTLPLGTAAAELLRDCCEEKLCSKALQAAKVCVADIESRNA